MKKTLPAYDEHQSILATDALASVDGFRVMVQLACQHGFGMLFCQYCPDCNVSSQSCQDLFGSHAIAEGGILGRVDAVYTSTANKHLQVVCMHIRKLLFSVDISIHVCLMFYTEAAVNPDILLNHIWKI